MSELKESLVVGDSMPTGGYTYTLASRVGEILNIIEIQYGDCKGEYTFLGVEFSDNGPQTWFPKIEQNKYIIIQLGKSAMNDEKRALFQLSHECVHLLDPTGIPNNASVLEEGAAVYLQHQYTEKVFGSSMETGSAKYDAAFSLVKDLIDINGDAILTLRTVAGEFGSVTEKHIADLCPTYKKSDAQALVMKFLDFNPL